MLTERAIGAIRQVAEKFLIDTVVAVRETGETILDRETGIESPADYTEVYRGPGRVRRSGGAQSIPFGDGGVMIVHDCGLNLPWDAPQVWRDDFIYVLVCADPELAGRWYRVTELTLMSQVGVRRVEMVGATPNRNWRVPTFDDAPPTP